MRGKMIDIQTRQVRLFAEALGAHRWDVICIRNKRDVVKRENITTDGLMRLLPFLRARNAEGYHVFIRPAGQRTVAYLDDLDARAIRRIAADGLRPLAVIETSPGRYQAWFRLEAGDRETLRALAERYGADPAAVGIGRFGRLPGFTNPKPAYERDGMYPFARLVAADPNAPPVPEAIPPTQAQPAGGRAHIMPMSQNVPQTPVAEPPPPVFGTNDHPYRSIWQRLAEPLIRHDLRLGRRTDLSRYDFNVARRLLREGYGPAETLEILRHGSPDLEQRHPGRVDDYLLRTVTRAAEFPYGDD